MNVPETVKIGGLTYTVTVQEDLHDNHKELWGWIRHENGQILLDSALSEDMQKVIIWHEIFHGILAQAGYQKQHEEQLQALAYGLIQVIKDNPAMRALLTEETP